MPTVAKPVTVTAEVLVNNVSTTPGWGPPLLANGNINNPVPITIADENAATTTWAGCLSTARAPATIEGVYDCLRRRPPTSVQHRVVDRGGSSSERRVLRPTLDTCENFGAQF